MHRGATLDVARGGRRLPHKPSESGQVEPNVGQEDGSSATGSAVDGHALEVPFLEGSITSFRGIASAVINTVPGRGAHGNVSHQAHGTVLETLTDVDDLTIGLRIESGVWTFRRRIRGILDEDEWVFAVETSLTTEPFVSLTLSVEAVGGERVAVRADRTPLVIEAAHRPFRFVVIGGVGTEVDDAAGVQVVVDHVQEHFVAEASVTSDSGDGERRIEDRELG
jgi:hypothetical protein